ncbi:MAG: PCMD domain-containing protein [Bacteroidales bacterium]|jgi:hypothetical protein|nr:PCMD domain-containing protein [Bacteroidales bacterium]
MKTRHLFFFLIAALAFSSCTKDEALNSEADILSVIVPQEILKADPVIENNRVTIRVKPDTDLENQAPVFTLSKGATISPENGTVLDFTRPHIYTVTSENGKNIKEYTVIFIIAGLSPYYGFEHFRLNESGKYYVFYEVNENGDNLMDWASGNAGFAITAGETPPDLYPTTYTEAGRTGRALKLTTRRTGELGIMFNKPIAAGNIFMGTFDVSAAISSPLLAVKMGIPIELVPDTLKGYFKYQGGDVFVQVVENAQGELVIEEYENGEIPDHWDVYAIFYDNNGGTLMLDGTNRFTHENLMSVAHLDPVDAIETDQWTAFELPFVQKPGKTIDPQKLANGGYSISVVMSSSAGGDFFKGGVNSTLLIDDLEIVSKK